MISPPLVMKQLFIATIRFSDILTIFFTKGSICKDDRAAILFEFSLIFVLAAKTIFYGITAFIEI